MQLLGVDDLNHLRIAAEALTQHLAAAGGFEFDVGAVAVCEVTSVHLLVSEHLQQILHGLRQPRISICNLVFAKTQITISSVIKTNQKVAELT